MMWLGGGAAAGAPRRGERRGCGRPPLLAVPPKPGSGGVGRGARGPAGLGGGGGCAALVAPPPQKKRGGPPAPPTAPPPHQVQRTQQRRYGRLGSRAPTHPRACYRSTLPFPSCLVICPASPTFPLLVILHPPAATQPIVFIPPCGYG
ncbi:hypothetical protein I4F81_004507 [Pyropia yezoensis]|uniref:Uncharacterized protein n=1 Tax=Pyropia yezoensis TaxID=2788 RepID=A0ACC3BVI4_PYRYE|nr:hypothetical protein I4F81_004507 [Neopyropia yezoensis]